MKTVSQRLILIIF